MAKSSNAHAGPWPRRNSHRSLLHAFRETSRVRGNWPEIPISRIQPITRSRIGAVTTPCFRNPLAANGVPIPAGKDHRQTFWASQLAAGLCLQAYPPRSALRALGPRPAGRGPGWSKSLHPTGPDWGDSLHPPGANRSSPSAKFAVRRPAPAATSQARRCTRRPPQGATSFTHNPNPPARMSNRRCESRLLPSAREAVS